MRVAVQVRYRQRPVPATACLTGAPSAASTLDEPVRGVAPGQAVVCYDGDVVVGGGTVEETR